MFLAVAAIAMMLTACDSSEIDLGPVNSPAAAENCPNMGFSKSNASKIELDPASPEFTVTVTRSAKEAATYAISVVENQDNSFIVPENVTFAADQTSVDITVKMKEDAATATPLKLTLSFSDDLINPYTPDLKSLTTQATLIKWNTIGKGQWIDGFWYECYFDVDIVERDDQPGTYRIKSPYTDKLIEDFEQIKATYTDYLVFYLDEDDYVSWDKVLYINTIHPSYGAELKGYYPSDLSKSLEENNATSYAERDEEGNILYFQINPYWYMDGVGGFGCKYPCYLAFPGVDLATELEAEKYE